MKKFITAVSFFIGLPGLIFLFLLLFGINLPFLERPETSAPIGALLIVLIVIAIGAETTHRVLREERDRAAQNFYSINPQARLERAHKVFYDLWRSAQENGHKWTLEQKRRWDEQVRGELMEHCEQGMLATYLEKTRPYEDPLRGISPLSDDKFLPALHEIQLLLNGRLKTFGK